MCHGLGRRSTLAARGFHAKEGAQLGGGRHERLQPADKGLFCPADVVTRGQMAAFLHRALG